MIPINQVILGGGDPLLGNSLDEQLQLIEKYKQNLEAAKYLVADVYVAVNSQYHDYAELVW